MAKTRTSSTATNELSDAGLDGLVKVVMNLSKETVDQINFIKENLLKVETEAEVVRVATSVCFLLLSEIERGNTIYIENKTGYRSRLNIERRK